MDNKTCKCGGTLQKYTGTDGGQIHEVPVMYPDKAYIRHGWSVEQRSGAMVSCNRCEFCEAA